MAENKPWGLEVSPEFIPEALKDLNRWVVWRGVVKGDKVDKIPYQSKHPKQRASVNNAKHWLGFTGAYEAYEDDGFLSGIGFVMTGLDKQPSNIFAIDLDHCIDAVGVIDPWADNLIESLPIYWELSPSGRGLRGFGFCPLPGPSFLNHDAGIEIYNGDSARFLTVTGHMVNADDGYTMAADPTIIKSLFDEFSTNSKSKVGELPPMPELIPDPFDTTALSLSAQSFARFITDGDIGDHDSRSEALQAATTALVKAEFNDQQIFNILVNCDHSWEVAMDHRQQNTDKAMKYLWREVCVARDYIGQSVADTTEFDFIDGGDFEPSISEESQGPTTPPTQVVPPDDFNGLVQASDYEGRQLRDRQWLVDEWIPLNTVTLLYGDGGTGKTLAAQDLMTAIVKGDAWNGFPTTQGPVLGFLCEDDHDELHRRQEAICSKYMTNYEDLTDLWLWSRVGLDNLLVTFDGRDRASPTDILKEIHDQCAVIKPKLLVLDAVADLFGGNENIRPQVRQFINALGRLALKHQMAVVLLAHPSLSGMETGTGGSTAWSNTVRSRLHLHREKNNPDVRVLEVKKSNYAGIGTQVRLMWKDGCFISDTEEGNDEFFDSDRDTIDGVFIRYMEECRDRGDTVGFAKNTEHYYARKFVEFAKVENEHITVEQFKESFIRIHRAGRVAEDFERVVEGGSDRRRRVLVLVDLDPDL